MMGICSLFGLSRGLSLLAEVVRIVGWIGKEGKADEGCRQTASSAGLPFGASALRTKRRRRCWGRGFRRRDGL